MKNYSCGDLLFLIWSVTNCITMICANPILRASYNEQSQQQSQLSSMDNNEDNHSEHVIRHRHRATRRLASNLEYINSTTSMNATNSALPFYECRTGFIACQPVHQIVLCINQSRLCDHNVDCPGGEDEDFRSCMHMRTRVVEVEAVEELKLRIHQLERENTEFRMRIKQYIDCKIRQSLDIIGYHFHDQENRVQMAELEESECERQLDIT